MRDVCFPAGKRTSSRAETYVSREENIENAGSLWKKCACGVIYLYMRVRARPREIHNVVSFPFLFVDLKKYSLATVLFPVIYKKNFKISSKKYCVKVAEAEKVRTFATAFERESR